MSKESDFVDLLNKEMYELKIANLEAKLAESEEQLKEELVEKKCLERALSACNRQNDEFSDMIKKLVNEKEELKQQLSEKEKNALALFSALYDILEEQDPENVSSRIDYLTKQNNGAISDFYKEHKVLKQKLEDKDKEIEYQESMKILAVENQNKKAIEQLEKVLKILEEKQFYKKEDTAYCVHPAQIAEHIDNQIKQLKGIIK